MATPARLRIRAVALLTVRRDAVYGGTGSVLVLWCLASSGKYLEVEHEFMQQQQRAPVDEKPQAAGQHAQQGIPGQVADAQAAQVLRRVAAHRHGYAIAGELVHR